ELQSGFPKTLVVTGFLLTFNLIFFAFKDTAVKPTCPTDKLKLGVCADLWVSRPFVGSPLNIPCCALLKGLANLEAVVCLCTALKAKVVGINLSFPVDLSLLLNYCGKKLPYGFQCA
ncbi:hypothetical protein BRARA_D02728, partial [Brassica rapa]